MATVEEVLARLEALEDPKARAINEKHGDDHGVNLTKLRALAKEVKPDTELPQQLWATGVTAARLVALLNFKVKDFSVEQLDSMLREAKIPKVQDWLVNYIVRKSKQVDALQALWIDDADPVVASAGWALTSHKLEKDPVGLDVPGLLKTISAQMTQAPERLQWAMNQCLATIGIENAELRQRAIDIGEKLEVLKDYPTPPIAPRRSRLSGSMR